MALAVRYAPWWLNLNPLRDHSEERQHLMEDTGRTLNLVPLVPREVFDGLPSDVKLLYRHWRAGS